MFLIYFTVNPQSFIENWSISTGVGEEEFSIALSGDESQKFEELFLKGEAFWDGKQIIQKDVSFNTSFQDIMNYKSPEQENAETILSLQEKIERLEAILASNNLI